MASHSETQRFALVTHEYPHSVRNLHSTKEKHHVTGNATISATHTVIMEEFDEDVLENEEIIANVKRFLRDGRGCSRGVKGGPCCHQFSEKLDRVAQCKQLPRTDTCRTRPRDSCQYPSCCEN